MTADRFLWSRLVIGVFGGSMSDRLFNKLLENRSGPGRWRSRFCAGLVLSITETGSRPVSAAC